MDFLSSVFLAALRASIHGETYTPPGDTKIWRGAVRLALGHSVLPLIIDAAWDSPDGEELCKPFRKQAKQLTFAQASRTAGFLLLYEYLESHGLQPAVMKGITLRALYPHSEQRASTDEDLLIRPEEFHFYDEVLQEYGLRRVETGEKAEDAQEVAYEDKERGLYLEIHKQLFPPDSEAYGDLDRLFDGALDRSESIRVYGKEIRTLATDDHLLYMLCHAYKHFLHGGFGIRQVCDIGMFAEKNEKDIDWPGIRQSCDSIRLTRFSAALFRICVHYLGLTMPAGFSDIDVDESDLLEDILTGGLYGVNDINRAHSATITLDAAAAQKSGKKSTGLVASVFLPLGTMSLKYPYLKKHPWLLPAAWGHRVVRYLRNKEKKTDPAASLRIGSERVALMREYGIID